MANSVRTAFLQTVIDQNDHDFFRMIWLNKIFIRNLEINISRFGNLLLDYPELHLF